MTLHVWSNGHWYGCCFLPLPLQLSGKWQDSMDEYQTMLFEALGVYRHAAAHLELMAGELKTSLHHTFHYQSIYYKIYAVYQ